MNTFYAKKAKRSNLCQIQNNFLNVAKTAIECSYVVLVVYGLGYLFSVQASISTLRSLMMPMVSRWQQLPQLKKMSVARPKRADILAAGEVGKLVAKRASKAGVKDVVFDRGGYKFHGRVKALAEAAREAGLSF